MNLFETAPEWLAWILVALLAAAALQDAIRLKISNILCLGVLVCGLIAIGLAGLDTSLWQNALVFAVLLAGGTLLFGAGKMGGGDVKLLAAVGLWSNFSAALTMLSIVFISGGILALAILGGRVIAPAGAAQRVAIMKPGSGIPYGIAIAAGAMATLALSQG